MRTPAAIAAAILAGLALAAPAHGQSVGYDVTCAVHVDVSVDRATGAYALDGIGSPCDVVMIDGVPRTELAVITGTGTMTGDPCASATWTGNLTARFRWRGALSYLGLVGTSTGPLLDVHNTGGWRRVRATLTLTPRNGTCPDGSFLAVGRMTFGWYSPLLPLP